MLFSRIELIKLGASATACSFAGGFSPLHAAQAEALSSRYLVASAGSTAAIVDLDSLQINLINLNFPPHGFVQNPLHPEKVWAFRMQPWQVIPIGPAEKGFFAAEINISERAVCQTLSLPEHEAFGGHGFYTPDGSVLFIPRLNMEKGVKYLTGYDVRDCSKIVADYPLGPGIIHDAQLLQDGTAMLASAGITNYTYQSRINNDELIQVDLRSGKPVRTWAFDDGDQWMSHFVMLKNGTLIAVSDGAISNTPGAAYIGDREDKTLQEIPYCP